jgi:hypothetical protein
MALQPFKHPLWTHTAQRLALDILMAHTSDKLFLPCADRCSKAGFRASLSGFFTNTLPASELWFFLLPLLPFYTAYWFWRRLRPQAGWQIDMNRKHLDAVRQKLPHSLQLTPEMGLLAHHKQIDITHPTRGPLLTLFTAAPSRDAQDTLALENLARTLAERLQLRLVGCRVSLN